MFFGMHTCVCVCVCVHESRAGQNDFLVQRERAVDMLTRLQAMIHQQRGSLPGSEHSTMLGLCDDLMAFLSVRVRSLLCFRLRE
jgi:hypothetical protein